MAGPIRSCVRSVSLPTRSHPSAFKVEEHLNKIKNAVCIESSLLSLAELYTCVEDFIQLPLTQQVLVHHRQEKLVEEVLDESISLLDACSMARDILSTMKRGIQDLQSALRRKRGEDSSMTNQTSAYISLRKNMKKDAAKCLGMLEKLAEKNVSIILEENHRLSMVIRVFKEASSVTISIFQRLVSFLYAEDSKRKLVGWSLVSKVLKNKSIVSENETGNMNEVQNVDLAVNVLLRCKSIGVEVEKVQVAQQRLKDLETSLEGLEDGVDCMFRRLIQTRVSLLNSRS